MIEALITPIASLLDKWIPDSDTKAQLAHDIATMSERHAQALALAQVEANRAEAGHRSLLVAGWRPFIGWTCGAAFAYHFVLQPLLVFMLVAVGEPPVELPVFDMTSLMTVLMGMLGLGGLRSFEKYKGVAK